jgi:general secretion pathway protein L
MLPPEAVGSMAEIVARDLAAKTPFRLADIYHDYQFRRGDAKVAVWQWVVRREFVENAAQSAGLSISDIAFVESEGDGTGSAPTPMVMLRQDRGERQTWLSKTLYGLAAGTAVLAAVGCAHKYWRQQQILDMLNAELTTARGQAQRVRAAMDKLDQMQSAIVRLRRQKRDAPGLLDVWEEVSKILPAHSWLTELRLAEIAQKQDQLIVMTGLATAAAELVATVDNSPLFVDAARTARIALDSTEQRERFTLQAKLQQKRQIEKPAP